MTADLKKAYTIKRFVFDPKYGPTGGNAKQITFDWRNKNGGGSSQAQTISVYDFFQRQYNITLQHWQLPLIETQRDGYFPMEVCTLVPNQKYMFKLSPDQVSFISLPLDCLHADCCTRLLP
jgi:eukaryotic translation initiation factor 2C